MNKQLKPSRFYIQPDFLTASEGSMNQNIQQLTIMIEQMYIHTNGNDKLNILIKLHLDQNVRLIILKFIAMLNGEASFLCGGSSAELVGKVPVI